MTDHLNNQMHSS